MRLDQSIEMLHRVGKGMSKQLEKLGILDLHDLLFHFPFRYDDFTSVRTIADLTPDENATVKVKIDLIANRRSRRQRKFVTEAVVSDDSGQLNVVWFNQPFLTKTLPVGSEVYLAGKVSDNYHQQMISPFYEKVSSFSTMTERLQPVYSLSGSLTQKQFRYWIKQCLPLAKELKEFLPNELMAKNKFLKITEAIENIHFPKSKELMEQAKERLKFDELFLIQLKIQKYREDLAKENSPKVKFLEKATKDFVAKLPFTLTDDQKKAAWEILLDLDKEKPMNRLLEGDVGSGKTIVVGLAILNVALNGFQSALMAPTEILARQHFESLSRFLSPKVKVALLTGSSKMIYGQEKASKKMILEGLLTGEIDLVIGTHALISDEVKIKDLALVAVDEQHRFGVDQRRKLVETGVNLVPHFLSLTATPIPRSLVLTLYGDLDVSVIKEKPKGRKPIITKLVTEDKRPQAYKFIKDKIKEGRQVFVICPLIEESDKLGVKSVTEEFEKLSKHIFTDLKISMLHGKMKSKEKNEVMQNFLNKKIDILVSTSVVEVGVDVPNAAIMAIEGAARFGLAQLHQFRGRVGRGEEQSYCFLFGENLNDIAFKRLKALERTNDGFKLAEMDLELRGPGEVYGTRQSGLPDLKIASLTDIELIKKAQGDAIKYAPRLDEFEELKKKVEETKVSLHFE
ncbi:MAG TPA: ATP-dependent DNA helicase RecG [Candidatus Bipolaricaulota bacterium]|nr:ATP-dependent DNA helicase RecG [Candidatus Bipolaricaulota bacterium]